MSDTPVEMRSGAGSEPSTDAAGTTLAAPPPLPTRPIPPSLPPRPPQLPARPVPSLLNAESDADGCAVQAQAPESCDVLSTDKQAIAPSRSEEPVSIPESPPQLVHHAATQDQADPAALLSDELPELQLQPTTAVAATASETEAAVQPSKSEPLPLLNVPSDQVDSSSTSPGLIDDKLLPPPGPAQRTIVSTAPAKPRVSNAGWPVLDPHATTPELYDVRNETLWMLIRRFDRQAVRVRRVQNSAPGQDGLLDLESASDMDFSPSKFRALMERMYLQVALPLYWSTQHLVRICTWDDVLRSGLLCALYFASWGMGQLLSTAFVLVLIVVVSRTARTLLFPPLVSTLPSKKADMLSGVADERQAALFVDTVGEMAVTMIGLGPKGQASMSQADSAGPNEGTASGLNKPDGLVVPQTEEPEEELLDPLDDQNDTKTVSSASSGANPKRTSSLSSTTDTIAIDSNDNLHKSIWRAAAPYLRLLVAMTDTWERLSNALNPSSPFAQWLPRIKMGGVVAGVALLCALDIVTPSRIYNTLTLALGLILFGSPVVNYFIGPPAQETPVPGKYPPENADGWPRWIEDLNKLIAQHGLLAGVPTNAQLALTLLRKGESLDRPFPPPPWVEPLKRGNNNNAAANRDPPTKPPLPDRSPSSSTDVSGTSTPNSTSTAPTTNKAPGSKRAMFKSFFKTSAQLGTETILGQGKVKPSWLNSAPSRYGLGPKPTPTTRQQPDPRRVEGPQIFRARYAGRRGLLYVLTDREGMRVPHLRWIPESRLKGTVNSVANFTGSFTGLNLNWNNGQSSLRARQPSLDSRSSQSESLGTVAVSESAGQGELYIQEGDNQPKLVEVDLDLSSIDAVRKRGGVNFSSRIMLSWMLDIQAVDVLELVTTDQVYRFADVQGREALFNRLVSLGSQQWELP